jgi:WD40 repeat protein
MIQQIQIIVKIFETGPREMARMPQMRQWIIACAVIALMAQVGWAEGETASCGAAPGSDTDYTITPCNVRNNEVFNMVVIGDSIAWGTGLNKNEKYSYLVAKWLAEQLGRPVKVKILAHTGATIESINPNPDDPISYPIYHPELASATPTLIEQADKLPDDTDFILVSGGSNDVGLDNVLKLDYKELLGFINLIGYGASVDDIRKKAEDIRPSMYNLLFKLLSTCPNARIVVTGYYTGISKDSKGITEVVATMRPDSQGLKGYRELDSKNKGQEVEKSSVFAVTANESLSEAVDEANGAMRAADSRNLPYDRVAFAPIFFPPERCYGTDQSWLWKMEQDPATKTMKTNDHMFETRKNLLFESGLYCKCEPLATCISEPSSPNIIENADSTPAIADEDAKVCKKYQRDKLDAVGHPNVEGANNYDESIIREIRAKWPTWLYPTVEAFDVSSRSLTSGESLEISYKVSDNGGSVLKQVELWRTQDKDKWPESPGNPVQTTPLSGQTGPTSGSFTDSPAAPGKYWYGVHVVDNAGNWNDERNSNTNGQPSSFEPKEVKVVKPSEVSVIPASMAVIVEPSEMSQELFRLVHPVKFITSVVFSPDGTKVATTSNNGCNPVEGCGEGNIVRIWDAETGSELHQLKHDKAVIKAIFTPDGTKLATINSRTAIIWNADTWLELFRSNESSYNIAFSPDSTKVAITGSDFFTTIWDAMTGSEIYRLGESTLLFVQVLDAAFSPDGTKIATAEYGRIRIWDPSSGLQLLRLNLPWSYDQVLSVSFSPDGSKLASLSVISSVATIWDAKKGVELHQLTYNESWNYMKKLIFSPDGAKVATISHDSIARIWDVDSGLELHRLNHDGEVSDIAFSPDGTKIATASLDRTTRIWDVESGSELYRLDHDDVVSCVAFSPDGSKVATGCHDGSARIWKLQQ